ncbi:hypothetical protein L6452_07934 [Arctium lappa]|uniref:Uncharacterized protein n=1 Tax=Arctium lappa TaxID=4217 RepID=A0ACB9EN14_ARCLA|nr:hypothetical protein L6452_07934 [Arctium lappa]
MLKPTMDQLDLKKLILFGICQVIPQVKATRGEVLYLKTWMEMQEEQMVVWVMLLEGTWRLVLGVSEIKMIEVCFFHCLSFGFGSL